MSRRREEFVRAMGWTFMIAAVVAAFRFGPNLPTFAFAAVGLFAALCDLDR